MKEAIAFKRLQPFRLPFIGLICVIKIQHSPDHVVKVNIYSNITCNAFPRSALKLLKQSYDIAKWLEVLSQIELLSWVTS